MVVSANSAQRRGSAANHRRSRHGHIGGPMSGVHNTVSAAGFSRARIFRAEVRRGDIGRCGCEAGAAATCTIRLTGGAAAPSLRPALAATGASTATSVSTREAKSVAWSAGLMSVRPATKVPGRRAQEHRESLRKTTSWRVGQRCVCVESSKSLLQDAHLRSVLLTAATHSAEDRRKNEGDGRDRLKRLQTRGVAHVRRYSAIPHARGPPT